MLLQKKKRNKKENVLGIHSQPRPVYTKPKKLETAALFLVRHAVQSNPSIVVINCDHNHYHEENSIEYWIISFFKVCLS